MSSSDTGIGELTAAETFEAMQQDKNARLVDVRTRAEWTFVGLPETPSGNGDPVLIEWQRFPAMDVTPDFAEQLEGACPDRTAPLYFICRSGGRSLAAARLAASRGYQRCFNVVDGFEGPPDPEGHRGRIAGWKAAGLPWRQS
jgi:rhodanese-related sulfurtransferase